MTTQQPVWKLAGHVGDIDPIAYGGGFVYTDETGVYPPELTYFEPAPDEEWKEKGDNAEVTVYRLVLDPPRFKTLTEKGKGLAFSTKELPASGRNNTWRWYNEWFVKDLPSVASSVGTSALSMLRGLFSKDPLRRAYEYQSLILHFGPDEFDSYPFKLTDAEAYERYAAEMKAIRKL